MDGKSSFVMVIYTGKYIINKSKLFMKQPTHILIVEKITILDIILIIIMKKYQLLIYYDI